MFQTLLSFVDPTSSIIDEFLQKEREYIKDLENINYFLPLLKELTSKENVQMISQKILEILSFTKINLKDIENDMSNRYQNDRYKSLVKVFLGKSEIFKVYKGN